MSDEWVVDDKVLIVEMGRTVFGFDLYAQNNRWAQFEPTDSPEITTVIVGFSDRTEHIVRGFGAIELLAVAESWMRREWTSAEDFAALPFRQAASLVE